VLETNPEAYRLRMHNPPLQSAIEALGSLPMLLWHDGETVIAGGWHEELAVKHTVTKQGSLEASGFYDYSAHQAVFGFDSHRRPGGFAYPGSYARDAGAGGSMGTRVVYRQKLLDNMELAGIYAYAGALVHDDRSTAPRGDLGDILRNRALHSVTGKVSGKVPLSKTELAISYKWLNGTAVSRQDAYGEAALGLDPYLSVSIRQPLPSFGTGHLEALADFRNVLSQGCVSVDGEQAGLTLVPVVRSFRGGLSFQF
jgi:hypothetical protein